MKKEMRNSLIFLIQKKHKEMDLGISNLGSKHWWCETKRVSEESWVDKTNVHHVGRNSFLCKAQTSVISPQASSSPLTDECWNILIVSNALSNMWL